MQVAVKRIAHTQKPWERGYNKEARVYVHIEGESILENLQNRRSRPSTHYRKNILPGVLAAQGITPERVQWSQRAGCSCPCSPGFILKGVRIRSDLHVTIRADEVTE